MLISTAFADEAAPPIRLSVDATDAKHKIIHCRETIPAPPGMLTLYYPKWIPGEHGPTGPINNVINLHLSVEGKPLGWQRDTVSLYVIRCEVPADAKALEVAFDYVTGVSTDSSAAAKLSSAQLVAIPWNQFLLYPAGKPSDAIPFQATLKVPPRWKLGTALPIESTQDDTTTFKPVSLTTLVDSPVIAGNYERTVILTEPDAQPSNQIDVVADSAAALAMPDQEVTRYKQLVAEASALFGATHYERYHFLICLSDHIQHNGLEHHESSLNTEPERTFLDGDLRAAWSNLLPHEFVHSWNGKYRRPASLATPDYQMPMRDDLLWIYEGLTEYLGSFVLTARSGLGSPGWMREALASTAAALDHSGGRSWRNLQDTATAASQLYGGSSDWANLRRGVDFYPEGMLIWLEVDTLIRQQTQGQKSLDDFCRAFHGGTSGPPAVSTYTFEDVVTGLNGVSAYDWASFLRTRLDSNAPAAPLGGVENGGYRVVYTDQPNQIDAEQEGENKTVDLRYSLGMTLREDGTVADVIGNGPALTAGIAPGMKLIAVNNRAWTPKLVKEAISATTKAGTPPVALLMQNDDYFQTYRPAYHGGERYPHLERDAAKPDLLEDIIRARAPGHAGPPATATPALSPTP